MHACHNHIKKLRDLLPWKRKGYKILEKYNISDVRAGDTQVLAEMVARNTDLNQSRHVVHYLYFPNDADRGHAEQALSDHGYKTRHGVSVHPKSLIAERHGLVSQAIIDQEREFLSRISKENHGEYDGWEAALD